MKVLVDTNVLLDVILQRPRFSAASSDVLRLVETSQIEGVVAAITLTTVHYLVEKHASLAAAAAAVRDVVRLFAVAAVDAGVIADALASGNPDFEDAVQAAAAVRAGATHVVTRDPRGFAASGLMVLSPAGLIAVVGKLPTP